jgi:hypothetical protein
MIPKSGHRFSEKIMLGRESMIPKVGHRFSEKIMLKRKARNAAPYGRQSWKSGPSAPNTGSVAGSGTSAIAATARA